jgi:hypothetical protein
VRVLQDSPYGTSPPRPLQLPRRGASAHPVTCAPTDWAIASEKFIDRFAVVLESYGFTAVAEAFVTSGNELLAALSGWSMAKAVQECPHLTCVASRDGITRRWSRHADKTERAPRFESERPSKLPSHQGATGKKLERKPQPQTNGSASLIPIWLAVGAANRERTARIGERDRIGRAIGSRAKAAGWRGVHKGRKIVGLKCGSVERRARAGTADKTGGAGGERTARCDPVCAKAAGEIPLDVSH